MLTGKAPARVVFARGAVGTHPIELALEAGAFVLVSDLAAEHPALQTTQHGTLVLGFPVKAAVMYPLVLVELPLINGSVIAAFAAGHTLAIRITQKALEGPETPIGVAQLRYVPER
jgi:hypothetical protein